MTLLILAGLALAGWLSAAFLAVVACALSSQITRAEERAKEQER